MALLLAHTRGTDTRGIQIQQARCLQVTWYLKIVFPSFFLCYREGEEKFKQVMAMNFVATQSR